MAHLTPALFPLGAEREKQQLTAAQPSQFLQVAPLVASLSPGEKAACLPRRLRRRQGMRASPPPPKARTPKSQIANHKSPITGASSLAWWPALRITDRKSVV